MEKLQLTKQKEEWSDEDKLHEELDKCSEEK